MSQNPNYVYQDLERNDVARIAPQEQHGQGVTGLGNGCILGNGTIYLGCGIISGDNSIVIGNDLHVDKDSIVIGSDSHRKVIIGGVDILDRLNRLEATVAALWDAPGMPGANLERKEFLGGN